ncbi:hypothetical protein OIE80_00705 [Streptomyces cellulosae]|nr:hypothetical protein OH715_34725 [Streptomyces cellulosae]
MTTKTHRWWWAAAAAMVVLAGCGSGEEGGGDGDRAAVLTQEQVRRVLPDGASMDGWKQAAKPTAVEMDDLYRREACPVKGNAGCEGSRYFGASTFQQADTAARVTYLVIAYDSEQHADAAYDVLWDGHYSETVGQEAKAFELGATGDERDARWGASGWDNAPGAVTQVRVGTTLLWVQATGAKKGDIDQDGVRDLTELLAERSRQAQNGDAPIAALGD